MNVTPIDNSTNEMETEAAIEAADKFAFAETALLVMNPLENHFRMRFTNVVSQENSTSKAYTLIDTVASLNFASKKFISADGFHKYCNYAPKLVGSVASQQHILTDKTLCPEVFTINGQ
jgi:hypothetical protein